MIQFKLLVVLFGLFSLLFSYAQEQTEKAQEAILFENVRIFDGKSEALSAPSHVLIVNNVIQEISQKPIVIKIENLSVKKIDGKGNTLMPGLIDAHWHSMLIRSTPTELLLNDAGFTNILAGVEATSTIMRGFTTVRDLGGDSFSLKKAIDEGLIPGPRIYPSGAIITVTSGHGDFRMGPDIPRMIGGPLSRMEALGGSMVADSPDEVRLRIREQLFLGASQVKLTAGGGVSSPHSPLDVKTFTDSELKAAVEAAENWGTYVVAHAFTPKTIKSAINAGVKCIEHGHLMDEETAKLIAQKGVWLSIQPMLDDEDAIPFPPGSTQAEKQHEVIQGTDKVYALAKKYKIKTAFGTDVLFSKELAARQGAMLGKLTRWYKIPELLKMATSTNAELLKLSGLRNPYSGKLGVVEKGALADLLLVKENPLKDTKWLEEPEKSLLIIMKDGKVMKDILPHSK